MNAASKENGSWHDITNIVKDSVKHLELGELLKCDRFTLLEAMSAIELMDPKMDSGMVLTQSNRKVYNLEQSVKLNLVKVNNLTYEELAGIIDDTYSCFATWLEGYPLAQTVMTNLYLLDIERIEDKCLRLFSQAILRLVSFIVKLVQMVFCIEEEDFALNVGGFNLANHLNDNKITNSIEELCHYYESLLSGRSDSLNSNNTTNNNNSHQNTGKKIIHQNNVTKLTAKEKSQLDAIINRLRFTHNFYCALLAIQRHILSEDWELNSQAVAQFSKTLKMINITLSTCDVHFDKCLDHLSNWSKSLNFGIKPDLKQSENLFEGDYPTIMGFEPLINQRILPGGFPRNPAILTRPATLDYLKNLIIRLKECISIFSSSFTQNSLNKSLDSIERFSKYFRPTSCVVSRSFLQVLYLPNRSVNLLKDEVTQSIYSFCDPLNQSLKKMEIDANAFDEFLTCCSKSVSQAIGIYGHNPARQHEKFPELIFSLKNLQYSAIFINSNSVIYLWTTFNLARFSIKYILSGLELELFSPHEYPYVFWYLYEILYKTEREQLDQARRLIIENMPDEIQRKGKGRKQRIKNQTATSFHDRSILYNDGFRYLAEGIFLLTHGLKMQGKIVLPKLDYTTEAVCFERRFGILSNTNVYFFYRQTIASLDNLNLVFRGAIDRLTEAKLIFESIGADDLDRYVRVCKTNMVVAKILSSNLESFNDKMVEFSFDIHPSFPTVKV